MMNIDETTYLISEECRYKNQTPKTQIIIGNSLRKDHNHIIRLKHKDFGKTKRWNNYTISREGIIYKHFDPKHHADYLGIKEADKQSISIVLENMGCLFKTTDGNFINWINETCDDMNVIEKKIFGYHYWEKYTEKQLNSLYELIKDVSDNFGIKKEVIEFLYYHKEIHKFKGIVFKSNYFEDSSNINPIFDIVKLQEHLNN